MDTGVSNCDAARSKYLRQRTRPSLVLEHEGAVRLVGLDRDAVQALGEYDRKGGPLPSILRVTVAATAASGNSLLPAMSGTLELLDDGIRFVPDFPFERGLSYRAHFDSSLLGYRAADDVLDLVFSLAEEPSSPSPSLIHIFPSSNRLPENLLRFYLCFSGPMQRGRAEAAIALIGPDGEPLPDALYRAPVELWDRSMRCLTVLLDPGRLKRFVGPNRELGPPLVEGQIYTLRIGAGMTAAPVRKTFRVTGAVREPVEPGRWGLARPSADTRDPLQVTFPRPLDWALLRHSITIVSVDRRAIRGQVAIAPDEEGLTFTPTSPWAAGGYVVCVDAGLEDVCGNNLGSAFDRTLRHSDALASEPTTSFLPFEVS